jgi:hypothetical protein
LGCNVIDSNNLDTCRLSEASCQRACSLPSAELAGPASTNGTAKGANSQRRELAKRKPGGQPLNRARYRHGLRSNRSPADATFIDVATDELRRNVEDAVVAAKGGVSLPDAFVVNSVIRHESRAQKIAHYLRSADGLKLGVMDRCQLLAQLSDATDRRDRAVRLLNLDTCNEFKPWLVPVTAQDAPGEAATQDGSEAEPNGDRATAGRFETDGGHNA